MELQERIRIHLTELAEPSYQAFTAKLIPNIPADTILGVRLPQLRAYAKSLAKDPEHTAFLTALPHAYHEENLLHMMLLGYETDFDRCLQLHDCFLPFISNWAVCDQPAPKAFRKDPQQLLPAIRRWIADEHPYAIRFAIKMLMDLFLDEHFQPEYPQAVASITQQDYYVRMMVAWYFATALAKQYDAVIPYLQ